MKPRFPWWFLWPGNDELLPPDVPPRVRPRLRVWRHSWIGRWAWRITTPDGMPVDWGLAGTQPDALAAGLDALRRLSS